MASRNALSNSSTLGNRALGATSVARVAMAPSARRIASGSSLPRSASPSASEAPSAYTSARTVRGSPSKSSGAAYFGVSPAGRVPPSRHGAARPRSTSVAAPSGPTMMFAGFTSP